MATSQSSDSVPSQEHPAPAPTPAHNLTRAEAIGATVLVWVLGALGAPLVNYSMNEGGGIVSLSTQIARMTVFTCAIGVLGTILIYHEYSRGKRLDAPPAQE